MINKTTKVLLIYELEGRLGAPVSNANSKEEIAKMKKSPCEYYSKDKIIIPKHRYIAPNNFKARSYQKCVHRTTLSEVFVQHAISESSCPIQMSPKHWKSISPIQRLETHLSLISEGRKFTYELLN